MKRERPFMDLHPAVIATTLLLLALAFVGALGAAGVW